jgi:hypothetical protein
MKRDNSRRVFVRQRPQYYGIHDAENGSVRTDAQRQRERGNSREAWIFSQHAGREAQILEECFKKGKPAPVAIDFFGLFNAAEFYKRLPPCFCRAHACALIVFDVHLEMAFHLVGEIALAAIFAKETGQADE